MKAWYTQELYNRKVLGIKNMQNSMMKRLQLTKREAGGKLLSPGEINYDILNSQTYALQLNYLGIVDRDLPDEDEPNHYTPHEVPPRPPARRARRPRLVGARAGRRR